MTERPPRPPVDADDTTLAPGEQAALDESVRPVGTRGRGATIAAVLIVIAFVAGLARPWDWIAAAPGLGDQVPVASGAVAARTSGPSGGGSGPDASDDTGVPVDPRPAPTCGYPTSWRSSTIQAWAGRRARVWTAVDVARGSDPEDPAIDFQVVAGEDFTAIGWCAPVTGDERPPGGATARLFRVANDGSAVELPHVRLEPPAPSVLGELWVPGEGARTSTGGWPTGRYVITLGTADGTWSRSLGLELRTVPPPASRPPVTPSPAPSSSTPPPPSGTPGPTPGQTD